MLRPSVDFLRITAGLTDYRYLFTVSRLAKKRAGTPAAQEAERLNGKYMAVFHLGDLDSCVAYRAWKRFRQEIGDAIEALQ